MVDEDQLGESGDSASQCWYCGKRPASERSSGVVLMWSQPRISWPETRVTRQSWLQCQVRIPRCASCKRLARRPQVFFVAGAAVAFLVTVPVLGL
jgi:hypothetical protein